VTIVQDEVPADAIAVVDVVAVEDEVGGPARSTKKRWPRIVTIVVIAALAAVLVFELFTGPVERLWYRNRQQQLAADLKTPHRGIAPGQALAVLQIPKRGLNVVVTEGDSPERLRSGPGHRVATPRPGKVGNVVISGHRTSWGGPFGPLTTVRVGDYVVLQDKEQITYVYKVRSIRKVGGDDTSLVQSSNDHRLTLVTGRGGRFSDDRLIVTAISGKARRGEGAGGKIKAETPGPSLIFNLTLIAALTAFALMHGAWCALRHRTGRAARIVVMVPLGAAGLLALLLWVDLFMPPLH
jgi:LPXTG-site transpeptidase (sortase) family protein